MTSQKRVVSPIRNIRSGLTLIEVLIATTITLLMMLALAQGFKTLSQTVSEGRSKLILSDQLRGLSQLLRNDLEGRTTDSSTPQSGLLPMGYFKYYDGPISDATAALFNHVPTAAPSSVESRLSASRWGDIDDILMFTAKAASGQVFRGKVPWALLVINRINVEAALGNNWIPSAQIADWNVPDTDGATGWTKAWKIDVTISSEYAEIVWFMMPMNELNSIDPNSPDTMVFDVIPGVDRDGDGVPDTDGMPDRIALCRRVLLIRPDLNITPTAAMIGTAVINGGAAGDYLTMQPRQPVLASVNTFRHMMQYPYQRCDLSVRPVPVPVPVPINGLDFFTSIGTNSIESLQLLENRFAHYGAPIGALGTTIPSLALSTEPPPASPLPRSAYLQMTDPVFANIGIDATQLSLRDRGFLPSCFMRTKPVPIAGGGYDNVPQLEEVVASNVVAFDLKGFDTSVKQLAYPGADGGWGDVGVDDDLRLGVDNVGEAGWPGTDDLSLTPADPGYGVQLYDIATLGATYEAQSGTGAYVDAGWGSKVYNSVHPKSSGPFSLATLTAAQLGNVIKFFPTSLSLIDLNATATGLAPASSLYDSGTRYFDTLNPALHQTYQPAFDTFTTVYEYDGEALIRSPRGLIWQQGLRRFGFFPTVGGSDVGTAGFGAKEAIPQIPYRLPSIQATIRVQDVSAGSIQQVVVAHDLTN